MKELISIGTRLFFKVSIYYSIITFLLILVILGFKDFGFATILSQILPPLFATVTAGLIFDYFETRKWQITLGPIVSGLIIGLVSQFGEKTWVLILIGFFAMASKFLFKLYGKNIFNPAATGLLIGIVLLSSHPAWWGGEKYPWIFYLWIPGLLLKLKRWSSVVSFLLLVAIFSGFNALISGSLLFFSSVMLIEPMTSPVKIKVGFIYGILAATGYLILGNFTYFDPLIPSLLSANILGRYLDRHLN